EGKRTWTFAHRLDRLFGKLRVAVERTPEVPAGHRAVRAPPGADLLHLFRGRPFAHPICPSDRVLDAEVELRQHVAPAESEHEEHLRRPAPDALHLHEMRDEL